MQGDGKVCGILIENLLNNESFYSMIGFGFNISIPDNLICFIDGCPDNLDLEKKEIDLIIGTTASIFLKNISLYENHGLSIFQKKWIGSRYDARMRPRWMDGRRRRGARRRRRRRRRDASRRR